MKNLRAILTLLGTISLTTVSTSLVVACNTPNTQSLFEKNFSPPVLTHFSKTPSDFYEWPIAYNIEWVDNDSGDTIKLYINADIKDAIEKINLFIKQELTRDTSKKMNKIKFKFDKKEILQQSTTYFIANLIEIS